MTVQDPRFVLGIFDRFKKKDTPEPDPPLAEEEEEEIEEEEEERVRCGNVVAVPLGDGREVARIRGGQQSHLVPEFAMELLRRCVTWQTVSEHAAALAAVRQLSESHSAIEHTLADLFRLGLLVRESETLSALSQTSEQRAPITTVGILTCDRPELAARCLSSCLANKKKYERDYEVVLFDDSRSEEDAIRALAAEQDVAVFGRKERHQFAARLAGDNGGDPLPADLIDFALFGGWGLTFTTGANRNAFNLHAAGELALSLDEDTVFRFAQREQQEGLELTSRFDPTSFRFYADRSEALRNASFVSQDYVALYEQVLGRSVGACVRDQEELTLDPASPQMVARLVEQRGTVVVATSGIVGDSGMGTPFYYLLCRDPTHTRLLEDYEHFRTTREVFRSSRCLTISEGTFLMTPAAAFDLRGLLPPHVPVQRNSDGLLGVTIRAVCPDGYLAHLPWAVAHQPQERRATLSGMKEARMGTLTHNVINLCINACPFSNDDPESRMARLGRHLQGLGDLPRADFEELVRIGRWRQIASVTARLLELLSAHDDVEDSHPTWVDDAEEAIEDLTEAAVREDYIVPRDLLRLMDAEQARTTMQHLVKRYGELVSVWPEIVRAAKRLAEPNS